MLVNLHTHTHFSDGSAPPEDYIKEAVKQGFFVLGFSDHSPIPIPNSFAIQEGGLSDYCEAVFRCKVQGTTPPPDPLPNKGGGEKSIGSSSLEVLLGLEYDYIPGLTEPVAELRKAYPFDYIIGSVHLVRNVDSEHSWFIDGPNVSIFDNGLHEVFGGDIRFAVTTYWQQVHEMIVNEQPDIIGHLDKIKMHNRDRFFREDESWYINLVDETLDLIKQSGAVVEVNTRGLYKKRSDTLFPGPEILKKIRLMDIPITLTSDAHKPAEISRYFPEAKTLLEIIGFQSQFVLTSTGWHEIGI